MQTFWLAAFWLRTSILNDSVMRCAALSMVKSVRVRLSLHRFRGQVDYVLD